MLMLQSTVLAVNVKNSRKITIQVFFIPSTWPVSPAAYDNTEQKVDQQTAFMHAQEVILQSCDINLHIYCPREIPSL